MAIRSGANNSATIGDTGAVAAAGTGVSRAGGVLAVFVARAAADRGLDALAVATSAARAETCTPLGAGTAASGAAACAAAALGDPPAGGDDEEPPGGVAIDVGLAAVGADTVAVVNDGVLGAGVAVVVWAGALAVAVAGTEVFVGAVELAGVEVPVAIFVEVSFTPPDVALSDGVDAAAAALSAPEVIAPPELLTDDVGAT